MATPPRTDYYFGTPIRPTAPAPAPAQSFASTGINVNLAPRQGSYKYNNYNNNNYPNGLGPGINPNNELTNIFITGNYTLENEKDILQQFGILFDGNYREKMMDVGIFSINENFKRKGKERRANSYWKSYKVKRQNGGKKSKKKKRKKKKTKKK